MAEVKDKLITVESAKVIYDSLDNKFNEVVYADEDDSVSSSVPMNADTLGGHPVSDFATKDELNGLTAADVEALSLDGSEDMTGSLKIKGYGEIDALDTLTYLKAKKDSNNFRYLRIINPLLTSYKLKESVQLGDVVNKAEEVYNLFGEHNKPLGSYTGNASTTARTVDTKALGHCCLIWRDSYFVIATDVGALVCDTHNKQTAVLGSSNASYSNGVLRLATAHAALNENAKIYSYQVL